MSERTAKRVVFIVGLVAGLSMIWLALATLLPINSAIGAGAPLVTLSPRAAAGLPIGVAGLAFAAMALLPSPEVGSRRRHPLKSKSVSPAIDWPMVCLAVAAISIVLSGFASPIAYEAIDAVATGHGYVQCPPSPGLRHVRYRWAHAAPGWPRANCPLGWSNG